MVLTKKKVETVVEGRCLKKVNVEVSPTVGFLLVIECPCYPYILPSIAASDKSPVVPFTASPVC